MSSYPESTGGEESLSFIAGVEDKEQPISPHLNGASKDLQLRIFGFDPEEQAWRDKALCRGMGEAIFFPERGYSMLPAYVICHSCPVRIECLESAIDHDDDHGVRAGFTPYERDKIKMDLAEGLTLREAIAPRDESRERKLRKARVKQHAQAQAFLVRGE